MHRQHSHYYYDVGLRDSTALKVIEENRMYTTILYYEHTLYKGLYHNNGGYSMIMLQVLYAGPIPFHKRMGHVNWCIVLTTSTQLQAIPIPFIREKTALTGDSW